MLKFLRPSQRSSAAPRVLLVDSWPTGVGLGLECKDFGMGYYSGYIVFSIYSKSSIVCFGSSGKKVKILHEGRCIFASNDDNEGDGAR